MKILYIGKLSDNSNCSLRMNALKKLGYNVIGLDPFFYFLGSTKSKIWHKIHYSTGYIFLQKKVFGWFDKKIESIKFIPDIVWIDGGELINSSILELLKKYTCPIILLNNDDVTGKRDKLRFLILKKAIKYFDHCFVYRHINIEEYKKLGAKKISLLNFSYDEVAHKRLDDIKNIPSLFLSDISFIGTYMRDENRDEIIYYLIKNGLNVSIWGNHWHKSKYWKYLKQNFKGDKVFGENYVKAIQGSKISIGCISKTNRDKSTRRSVEIPYAGGLLCAERTEKHLSMFIEGKEAVFWSSKEECLDICKRLLLNESLRIKIKEGGRKRVIKDKYGNLELVTNVLKRMNLIN